MSGELHAPQLTWYVVTLSLIQFQQKSMACQWFHDSSEFVAFSKISSQIFPRTMQLVGWVKVDLLVVIADWWWWWWWWWWWHWWCVMTGALQRRVDDVARQLDVQRNRLNVRYTWLQLSVAWTCHVSVMYTGRHCRHFRPSYTCDQSYLTYSYCWRDRW